MNQLAPKLEWEEKYSVGVQVIDAQHQKMFATINELIDTVGTSPTKEKVMAIIGSLVEYKKFHFATEENYFREFNYEGTDAHIVEHSKFNQELVELQEKAGDDYQRMAFDLVDFLEDWLINHIMTTDQAYKECFLSHGLK